MFRFIIVEKVHEESLHLFNFPNVITEYVPSIKRHELIKILPEVDGILIRKTEFDEELINASKKLKFVARAGAGVDNIRVDLLKTKGIELFTANEANKDAVAEHTIGVITCIINKIHLGNQNLKAGVWDREINRGTEIKGKTISIIGFGNTGSAVAERLIGWQCEILFYDKHVKHFAMPHARQAELDEIYEKTDILSLHLPLDYSTKYWFNEQKIESFKKPIVVINTSRGEITRLKWLRKGLESGKIIGLGLDVFDREPLDNLDKEQKEDFNYLASHNAVVMTPHVAGWTIESFQRINVVLSQKIRNFLIQNKILL
jgi:D-3-phosphoglycerate dehydrogenase